ncbi:MAG: ribonuclease R [Planctomycetales bacterium]|nr:ribonuclease R [Planctomycetales bacterium]
MNEPDLGRRLLEYVLQPNYRPVKPRVIAKKLQLDEAQTKLLKRELKRLIKSGKLVYGSNHLVKPGAAAIPSKHDVVGTFRRASAGYGFVRPQGTSAAVGRDQDIFVPASRTADASNGDLVRVRTKRRPSRDGGTRIGGEVIEILNRGRGQFVGTYFERGGQGFVQIDGTEFPDPIAVGDPGAKGVQPNDKVSLEMVRYPTPTRPGVGVLTEVLGKHGEPGVDTKMILREFSLPEGFPEAVMQAAREQAEQFDGEIAEGRRDLTDLIVATIDPVDARDYDDAISLELLENGHWRLGVHIADVSHFVRPKSPIDQEARERATSVYLPDRVIPMLPEVISNHLASLQPDQVRFVKTAFIEYTSEGVRVATDFCTGAIRSRKRLTYEEVDVYLEDRIAGRVKFGPDVSKLLDDMHRLAMVLRKRRLERGSIELNLPEVKIELDREGKVRGARKVERTESHQIIEEFMLAANESVAERLNDLEIAFLRRIHAAPDPKKMETLTEFVRELGIECESLEDRFEIKRVLFELEGEPIEQAVNYAVLRAMTKAVYGPDDMGHYALGIKDYCHFTSPIRRYPDLTIHRLMETVFQGGRPQTPLEQLISLGDHCSQREQRAEAAERELIKLKLLGYLSDKIGQTLDVVITGVEEFGLFAQGLQLPAEGLIHISTLADDHYDYDASTHALVGRRNNIYRLGDLLSVEIAQVDLDRRELDFIIRERLQPDVVLHHNHTRAVGKKPKKQAARGARAADKKKGSKSAPIKRKRNTKGRRRDG